MGEVILVYKIMPNSPDSFEKVKGAVEDMKPARIEEEPIAFGLKAIKVTFVIPDEGGHVDKLENKLESIDDVENVENIMATRSL